MALRGPYHRRVRSRARAHDETQQKIIEQISLRLFTHGLPVGIPIREITTNIENTMKYKISFLVTTDADPTLLLDIATLEAKEFCDRIEADYSEWTELDDESPCVQEVTA